MTIEVHREIMSQLRQALNRRGYFDKRQITKRREKGLSGKFHGFDHTKYTAASMFYLPAQAAAGPDASFFLTFDDGKRKAVNPYEWIDRSIINHRPEPQPEPVAPAAPQEPPSLVRKDPRLTRMLMAMEAEQQAHGRQHRAVRVQAAIDQWRCHQKGSGNHEFFALGASLAAAGVSRSDAKDTLHDEADYAHGLKSQRDRRASIPAIMDKLHFAA